MSLVPSSRTLETAEPLSALPGTVLFETDRLLVRRWQVGDEKNIAGVANHVEIFKNLRDRFPSPYTQEEADSFIARRCDPKLNTVYPTHAAVLVKSADGSAPVLVGGVGAMQGDDVEYRSWELGYWFDPKAWGNGYATELVKGLVPWLFKTWPRLNRVFTTVFTSNPASVRVMDKSGFVKEGLMRGVYEKCGVLVDAVLYSVVRSDLEDGTFTN